MWLSHMRHYHMDPPALLLTTFEQTTWANFHIQKIFFFFIFCCAFICCNFRLSKLNNKQKAYWGEREYRSNFWCTPRSLSISLSCCMTLWFIIEQSRFKCHCSSGSSNCQSSYNEMNIRISISIYLFTSHAKEEWRQKKSQLSTVEIDDWLSVCLSLSLCLSVLKLLSWRKRFQLIF